jgi:predicted Rossmann fold nucleotide-binding protein DprA/Smf involved in DNA uptake
MGNSPNLPNKFPYKGALTVPFFYSSPLKNKNKGEETMKKKERECVGVVGSRTLSYEQEKRVRDIVLYLLNKSYRLSSGGAVGADQFCLESIIQQGKSSSCTVYSPWRYYSGFPKTIQAMMKQFKEQGGTIKWGLCGQNEHYNVARVALLERNVRLVKACYGIVAFIDKNSRGSIFTIKQAIKQKKKVVVFPIDCEPPKINNIVWRLIKCTGPWAGSYVAKTTYEANS